MTTQYHDLSSFTPYESAVRTADPDSHQYVNRGAKGLFLTLDLTSMTLESGYYVGTLTVTVERVDPQTGNSTGTLLTISRDSTGTSTVGIHPNYVPSGGSQVALPPVFRIKASSAGSLSSATYSVTANLVYT